MATPRVRAGRGNRSEMGVVHDGLKFWHNRVLTLTRRAQQALELGEVDAAARYLERARVAEMARDKWRKIEDTNVASGMTRVRDTPAPAPATE